MPDGISVRPTKKFLKGLKQLPPDRVKRAVSAIERFKENPSLPSLQFRALKGMEGYFIISATKGDRIILFQETENRFIAEDVGPHDNVYRRMNR